MAHRSLQALWIAGAILGANAGAGATQQNRATVNLRYVLGINIVFTSSFRAADWLPGQPVRFSHG